MFFKFCHLWKKTAYFQNINYLSNWALIQKKTYEIAHNLKGFDGVFILKYFLENILPFERTPDVILTGC